MDENAKRARQKIGEASWKLIMASVDSGTLDAQKMHDFAFGLGSSVGGNHKRRVGPERLSSDRSEMSRILGDWWELDDDFGRMSVKDVTEKLIALFKDDAIQLNPLARDLEVTLNANSDVAASPRSEGTTSSPATTPEVDIRTEHQASTSFSPTSAASAAASPSTTAPFPSTTQPSEKTSLFSSPSPPAPTDAQPWDMICWRPIVKPLRLYHLLLILTVVFSLFFGLFYINFYIYMDHASPIQLFSTFNQVWEAGGDTSLYLKAVDGKVSAVLEVQLGPPSAPRPGAPVAREAPHQAAGSQNQQPGQQRRCRHRGPGRQA